ncbi:MAG: hypothetical protein QF357_07780 [Dehalococcoidia bacterium]|nr:hypothetical protein [Dehalococcoidia bacterium]
MDVEGVSGFDPGQDEQYGQWRILSDAGRVGIEFTWSNGQTSAHLLQYENNQTYIDEDRWFVTNDNNYCQ